jgi:hypothetical protein
MPEKQTIERARRDKREGKSTSTHKQVNSYGKRFITFGRENMVPVRQNKRLPLDYRRRAVPV